MRPSAEEVYMEMVRDRLRAQKFTPDAVVKNPTKANPKALARLLSQFNIQAKEEQKPVE